MYYVGMGTMAQMIAHLTLSYASRRLVDARAMAERDIYKLEYSEIKKGDLQIVRIQKRMKALRRSTGFTGGHILHKVVDGVSYHFRAGSYLLVRDEFIYNYANNPETLWVEWEAYQEQINRHNEYLSRASFSDLSSWFQQVHGAPLPAREHAEQIYADVEAAITSNGWAGSAQLMEDPAGYLACIETQGGHVYADHQSRPDLALLIAYVQAHSLKANALMAA